MDTAQGTPRLRGRPGGRSGADLLAVARDLLLDRGFAGTTMDAVAAGARISKQTLYRQYPSKDDLYAAVVRDWVDRGRDAMRPHLDALVATDDAARGLRALAGALQAGVLSGPVLRMRALVSAEAERFPEVADDYVRRSWDRNQALLADALARLADRNLLHTADPASAAEQFTWLALAAPLNRLTLTGGRSRPTQQESDAVADEAVATFLARYAPSGSGD
ncbi:TetR/AcrR family transcriptional regulator [Tsukamurella sp. PLM1]|uniref:TetR/AcrR family transcriptional regulator n=1 Tax=Tsukamurella sp. PLM1 TaxID=2929795 RepID=UPI0020503159|nr:TetR/AcrR family transcriptional regulator [Tsukamurella sp. PLM1]BDH56074.1 transcriptional regulator [Tsukamurella sp. PLM1]